MKQLMTFFGALAIAKFALAANFLLPANNLLEAQGFLNNDNVKAMALNWKVGDNAQYKLAIGGFINGTMNSFVREETNVGFWFVQDMDLGSFGQQKVEIHIHKGNGEILELIVNGEKQNAPDNSQQEVVDHKEANVTVPAGTFFCVHLKIKDNSQNGQITETWINPQTIPVTGMIKTIAPSQIGQAVLELTGFEKK